MKRNLLKLFSMTAVAFAAIVSITSCTKPTTEQMIDGLSVTAVTPSFNGVTFTVNATPASAVAYICLPEGQSITASEIFDKGTIVGSAAGTFTLRGLKSSTKYTLFVAKLDKKMEGPSWVNFTTTENGGLPPTVLSAGIRLESIDKGNVVAEITNGDSVDYSFTGVWPEIYMENYLFEAEKTGVSREQYLTDLVLGYPYLCATTVGRGKSGMIDYSKDFPNAAESKLWPAADYMIITLGMQGDPKLGKDGIPGEIHTLKVRTDGYERQGVPGVRIDTLYTDYIKIRYKFTPNTDAACFAIHAAKKAEYDEFVQRYDEKRGAGQGVAMLQEFVRFSDPFIKDHTDVYEFTLTAGFEQDNIDFEMIAVPMDRNLMPGDMARNVNQVRPTPKVQVDAEYTFTVDKDHYGVGASNFWYTIDYGKNCANVYWRITNQAAYDAEIKKLGTKGYARDLWTQGWGEDRPSNPTQSETFSETQFRFFGPAEAAPGQDHIIVAVAKNYTGGLSEPRVIGPFATQSIKYSGDHKPGMEVKVVTMGKTQVACNYKVENYNPKADHDPRILRHIIFEDGDPLLSLPDKEFMEMLYKGREVKLPDGGKIIVAGNEWACYSNDIADKGHEYDWNYTWTGMKSNQKYHYIWMTEDQYGNFSQLKKIEFTTPKNDGGPNPAITIAVDKKSIMLNPSDKKQYMCAALITPNADAKAYTILWVDRYAYLSHDELDGTKEQLETGLSNLINKFGLTGYTDAGVSDVATLTVGHKAWVAAVAFGAAEVRSKLVYVEFDEKGNVGEMITSPVKVSLPAYNYYQSAPMRGIEELKARSARVRAADTDVKVLPPFSVGEIQAYQALKAQQTEPVKYKSLKELTLEVLTHGHSAK